MSNLNEVKQAIILAAGRSRRMEKLSRRDPKCLLPYKGERVLERLVRQIKDCGIEKIYIVTGYCADKISALFREDPAVTTVENRFYEEDVNILSLSLAISRADGPVAIFEADVIMEDGLVKYVLGSDFEGKSVWFTRGPFTESQYGGILRSDKYGRITDIRIVSAYNERYRAYSKLTGIMRVGAGELELFRALVNKYAKTSLKQYFLTAWIENLRLLPCWEADITPFHFYTFNKPEEYYQVQSTDVDAKQDEGEVQLVETAGLHCIEAYDDARVKLLLQEIAEAGQWTVPLVAAQGTGLVLDGQHRLEAAKRLGLARIPAVRVNYGDVSVWSLRKEIKVSQKRVEKAVLKDGTIYPYKTVKHKFPFDVPDIHIPLEELR